MTTLAKLRTQSMRHGLALFRRLRQTIPLPLAHGTKLVLDVLHEDIHVSAVFPEIIWQTSPVLLKQSGSYEALHGEE